MNFYYCKTLSFSFFLAAILYLACLDSARAGEDNRVDLNEYSKGGIQQLFRILKPDGVGEFKLIAKVRRKIVSMKNGYKDEL